MANEKLTHWKRLVNPDYLGAYSLDKGKDMTLTIKKVVREIVKGTGGKKEECTVAYFNEPVKPMILNRTNSKTIQKVYSTPYIEEWAGKKITVYAATTKLAGEEVECLRIRANAPGLKKIDIGSAEFDNCVLALKSGNYTIEQVKSKYELTAEVEAEMKIAAGI